MTFVCKPGTLQREAERNRILWTPRHCNLLYNRLTYIKFNGCYYGPRRVFKGVIQGGILSPLIYLLYQYKMNVALGSVVKNIQYADDLTLYSAHSSFSSAVYNMNKGLTSLQQYLTNLSFEVNIEKSACIVFNTKCKKRAIISYCNRPIKIVNKFKFLGMLFDQSLNWKSHIEKIYVTGQRAINILKPMAFVSWGADPRTIKMLYKSIVHSHLRFLITVQYSMLMEKYPI